MCCTVSGGAAFLGWVDSEGGGGFQNLFKVWMGGLDEFRVRIHTFVYLHMHLAHVYAE